MKFQNYNPNPNPKKLQRGEEEHRTKTEKLQKLLKTSFSPIGKTWSKLS